VLKRIIHRLIELISVDLKPNDMVFAALLLLLEGAGVMVIKLVIVVWTFAI
jgi:hypothetical protein